MADTCVALSGPMFSAVSRLGPGEACKADRTVPGLAATALARAVEGSAAIAFASALASASGVVAAGVDDGVGLAPAVGVKISTDARASRAAKSAAPGTLPRPRSAPPLIVVSMETTSPLAPTASNIDAAPA